MSAPFEIIAAPFTLYLAPVGTEFPTMETDPLELWYKVGTSGTKSYDEAGVTVTHDDTKTTFTPAGGRIPRKVWRTEEQIKIECELVDLSPEQYAKALNDQVVTTVAAGVGIAGEKNFPLELGADVALFALVARGPSTVDDSLVAQYEVPIVYQGEKPAPVHTKGKPASLKLGFYALEDDVLGSGKLRIQTAAPTS